MRLRNKQTGKVHKIYPCIEDTESIKFMADDGKHYEYETLKEMLNHWEDV